MIEKIFMYGLEKISDKNRKKERYAFIDTTGKCQYDPKFGESIGITQSQIEAVFPYASWDLKAVYGIMMDCNDKPILVLVGFDFETMSLIILPVSNRFRPLKKKCIVLKKSEYFVYTPEQMETVYANSFTILSNRLLSYSNDYEIRNGCGLEIQITPVLEKEYELKVPYLRQHYEYDEFVKFATKTTNPFISRTDLDEIFTEYKKLPRENKVSMIAQSILRLKEPFEKVFKRPFIANEGWSIFDFISDEILGYNFKETKLFEELQKEEYKLFENPIYNKSKSTLAEYFYQEIDVDAKAELGILILVLSSFDGYIDDKEHRLVYKFFDLVNEMSIEEILGKEQMS